MITHSNVISNNNIEQTMHSMNIFVHCTDYFSNFQKPPLIDVINFSNGLLGKFFNLIKFKTISGDCPCGPSSLPGTQSFNYSFDKDNRIIKQIETYIYCHHTEVSPIEREITTIQHEYYNR
jgi:hypothetical protein